MKKLLLLSGCLLSLISYSQTIALQQVATGFTSAIGIEHPANDARLFIVQQGGLIRILNPNGIVNTTPFLNLTSLTTASGERGLLGLAFHPNYANNGLFYVNYINSSGNTVVARYSVSANPNVANTAGTILMIISQPYSNHNGGTLRFGPDGYLYIGMGDGGSSGDPQGYAQNMSLTQTQVAANPSRIFLGKMLRIDVDTTTGSLNYGIPSTNPYSTQAGKGEIWAIGLRNPWKFSFNRLNGDLWLADVGQNSVEEIDKIASPLPNTGLNFGWRCFEGSAPFSSSIGTCPSYASTVAPFSQYNTGTNNSCSITGGYFYTGSLYPNFQNKYFFSDYCSGQIGTVSPSGVITWRYTPPSAAPDDYVATLGEDLNGELYVSVSTVYSSSAPSTIFRIVDTSLSVNNFNKNGLSLYPNPAKTEIFINNSHNIVLSQVKIFDLTGKLVLAKTLENNDVQSINISSISSGMYLISLEDVTGNQFQSKLVVQ